MALYTREDAAYVMRYYADKIIGKMPTGPQYPIVDMLFIEECDTNQYEIYGAGGVEESGFPPKMVVESLARNMGLPKPADILMWRKY